jgi:hypothetical protein
MNTLLPQTDSERSKCLPFTYMMNYFPRAQIAKAKHSYESNLKHAGKEGMEWAMEKSVGDGNQIMRHLVDGFDHFYLGDLVTAEIHFRSLAWRGDELYERFALRLPPFEREDSK